MSIITVSDTANCLITHDDELDLVMLEWRSKPLNAKIYKETFRIAIEYQEQHSGQITNYMADVRQQPPIPVNFRKWFTDSMLPKGIHNGIKRAVFVLDANVFKRYYMNQIFNSIKKFGIPFIFFNTKAKAIEWIRKNK